MASELDFEVKAFIVQRLACYATPSEVVAAVKEEFNVVVSRQRVHSYDPTAKAGAELGEELKQLFERTRAALIEGTVEFGIVHKMVRLRWLDDMATAAKARGNFVLAAQLIEQAAKEMGGAYTNRWRHEHTGKDGKDLPHAPAVLIYKPTTDGRAPEIKGLPPGTIMLPDNGRDDALPPK